MEVLTISEGVCSSRAAVAVLLLLLLILFTEFADADARGTRVSALIVNRVNIFTATETAANPAYLLANKLHRTTRRDTVVRELDISTGDYLDQQDIEALERKLRGLNLFASVSVQMVTDGDSAGTVIVHTRDRFSIIASVDGSFLGGVGELGFMLGERNLSGYGDLATIKLTESTAGELRGDFVYQDIHWRNANQSALYRFGMTEEGRYANARLARPFQSPSDRNGWSASFDTREHEIDYYEGGKSVVQIPETWLEISGSRTRQETRNDRTLRRGISLRLADHAYDPVQGSQAGTVEQPQNNTQLSFNFVVGRDSRATYRKVTGMDTLRFIQDLTFNRSGELRFGAIARRYTDRTTVRPTVSGSYSTSHELNDTTYTKSMASLSSELSEDHVRYTAALGLKVFKRLSTASTLAVRLDYNRASDNDLLPIRYTLGESNGLRGYANRLLSGNKMLRLNLEHRYDLQRKIGFLDIGLVGFFDAGWVAPEPDPLKRSAGLGVRLGSTALLGRSVIRMDVAYPFDSEDASPVYSAALGQVFRF